MTNVELVKQIYADFATGNIPAVLGAMDPAIEWNECPGMVFVKDSGKYTGPEAVVAKVFMPIPEYFEGFAVTVTDVFGSGDRVCMEGFYEGMNKLTGKRFKAQAAHLWTVKDGKLTRFYQAVDTTTITA
jgi:uncharacterized protein